jgi:hypothetical protein
VIREKPTVHSTWLILTQSANFKSFFEALIQYLMKNMKKRKIGGSYGYNQSSGWTLGNRGCKTWVRRENVELKPG